VRVDRDQVLFLSPQEGTGSSNTADDSYLQSKSLSNELPTLPWKPPNTFTQEDATKGCQTHRNDTALKHTLTATGRVFWDRDL